MLNASPKGDRYIWGPSKRLLRSVRRELKYYGLSPVNPTWRMTWEWAKKISDSYYSRSWPQTTEIVAQYLTLLLAAIKQDRGKLLRLPYRAGQQITEAVAKALPRGSTDKLLAVDAAYFEAIDREIAAEDAARLKAPIDVTCSEPLPLFAEEVP